MTYQKNNTALFLMPFILGIGLFPVFIAVFIPLLLVDSKILFRNLQASLHESGYLFLASFTMLFLGLYWGLHKPYYPDIFSQHLTFFPILSICSLLTIFWIGGINNHRKLISFIWNFCLGSFIFCILTVGITMAVENRITHLYGGVVDVRYILFGIKKFINTPGLSNLLTLIPAAFLAGLVLESNQKPKYFELIGLLASIFSLVAAIALGQRSYFALALFICPLIVGVFLLFLRSWFKLLFISCILLIYPILWILDKTFLTTIVYRPINQELINDGRVNMLWFWIDQLIQNPFLRPEIGPGVWSHSQWFHNFFADIHRLSGFWALLTAVILVTYIFIRLLFVIRIDRRVGLFLMAIAIPCFLIMNTSVVPEGERQPFLLLLAIGAISEVILGRHRRSSESPHIDAGAKHNIGNA